MILIYTPCKDKKEAKTIANSLIKEKLVACANIIQSDAIYVWNNKLQNSKESILILKTKQSLFKKTQTRIKQLHSYKIPAILKLKSTANKEYKTWLNKQTL